MPEIWHGCLEKANLCRKAFIFMMRRDLTGEAGSRQRIISGSKPLEFFLPRFGNFRLGIGKIR
jgi:hypothetical protein